MLYYTILYFTILYYTIETQERPERSRGCQRKGDGGRKTCSAHTVVCWLSRDLAAPFLPRKSITLRRM